MRFQPTDTDWRSSAPSTRHLHLQHLHPQHLHPQHLVRLVALLVELPMALSAPLLELVLAF